MLSSLDYATGTGRFSRPASLAEWFDLAEYPESRFVAGNTDLGIGTNLARRTVSASDQPRRRGGIEVLQRDTSEAVEIGAALTLSEIAERWTTAPAVLP